MTITRTDVTVAISEKLGVSMEEAGKALQTLQEAFAPSSEKELEKNSHSQKKKQKTCKMKR